MLSIFWILHLKTIEELHRKMYVKIAYIFLFVWYNESVLGGGEYDYWKFWSK